MWPKHARTFSLTLFLAGSHQDGNRHAHRQFLDAEWGKLAELGRLSLHKWRMRHKKREDQTRRWHTYVGTEPLPTATPASWDLWDAMGGWNFPHGSTEVRGDERLGVMEAAPALETRGFGALGAILRRPPSFSLRR